MNNLGQRQGYWEKFTKFVCRSAVAALTKIEIKSNNTHIWMFADQYHGWMNTSQWMYTETRTVPWKKCGYAMLRACTDLVAIASESYYGNGLEESLPSSLWAERTRRKYNRKAVLCVLAQLRRSIRSHSRQAIISISMGIDSWGHGHQNTRSNDF